LARGAPRKDAPEEAQVAALVAVGVPPSLARERVAGQYDAAELRDVGDYPVLPCNWPAVRLFAELPPCCWDHPQGGGRPRGLRREQVTNELMLRGVRRREWPALWERIRVMEREALVQLALRGK